MWQSPGGPEYPWWLGNVPTGHTSVTVLSQNCHHSTSRYGKPSTSPGLISAQLSELNLPPVVHKVKSKDTPNYDVLSRSGKSIPQTGERTARLHCTTENKVWVKALENMPGDKGEIRPAWVANFHCSHGKVRRAGLTTSAATGYTPQPTGLLEPVVPEGGRLHPLDAPKSMAKTQHLETEIYRELKGRTTTLNALRDSAESKIISRNSTLLRGLSAQGHTDWVK